MTCVAVTKTLETRMKNSFKLKKKHALVSLSKLLFNWAYSQNAEKYFSYLTRSKQASTNATTLVIMVNAIF